MPNRSDSDFLVLRIYSNPHATFDDHLKNLFFLDYLMESRVQQGQLHLVMKSLKFLFPRTAPPFPFYLHVFAWTALTSFKLNLGSLLKRVQYLAANQTCQNVQIYFLAIEELRGKCWDISAYLMIWITSKKPLNNSILYTKVPKTVIIIHKICVL